MLSRRALKVAAWTLALALFVAIVPVSTVSAQSNALTSGEPVTGSISDTNYMAVWNYSSPGDETISVSVEATSGNLDTTLVIISSNLDTLGVNDDIDPANDNFNSAVNDLFIPNADTIFVIVSRFDTQHGASTGSYRLLLTSSSGGGPNVILDEPIINEPDIDEPSTIVLDREAIDGKLDDAFDHLIRQGVIPDWEGTIFVQIPDSAFLESFRADEHNLFIRVGQGREAADVVVRTDFIWDADDNAVACGVAFRAQGNGNAYTVYVGREGWAELGRWDNNGEDWVSIGVWDVSGLNTRNGGENNLVVTAVDDEFNVFVNYELVGAINDDTISGAGELYLALFKEDSRHLRCDYPDFWVITQDQ